ncbi:probable E3 ubiquitin-protein ligase ARI7 [Sesamum indicum]|uniref:RBR-type E3 ubiquitin transferase n=1 Tax=Sesamum indicum TaxID=4182 RepID=A0A6I9UBL5_SESIN|nr:probable E3 ubiquitin-protein ligase ARI7 [Sesamum indicum]
MDSDEQDLYYGSGGDVVSEEEDGYYCNDGDAAGDDEPDRTTFTQETTYTILREEDVKKRAENDIAQVSTLLSVSRGLACHLLCRNNWCLNAVYDQWFADAERSDELPPHQESGEQLCGICFEPFEIEDMVSASCVHSFCAGCWKTYISFSINDGPGCLRLQCPEPKCRAVAGVDMVESMASVDEKQKYYGYLYRSYVECNRNRKWCPASGCEFAVEFKDAGGCESYDVTCDCYYKFCWNCIEESHRPVDCKTVEKWIKKNSSEAENTNWILAYTKPCPKCHRAIEKNQGCNHMTCRSPCKHQFCWVCLGPWEKHTSNSTCNTYRNQSSNINEESRERVKHFLARYTHYYERWDSNDKSKKRALTDLNQARNQHIDTLAQTQGENMAGVQFVIDAWTQIVECRRVLKWSYAYGYYHTSKEKPGKLDFFGYLQGEAEAALERLHYCAEKEMSKYLIADRPLEDFKDFKSKLLQLTAVTGNYFQNLVLALENDLSEVDDETSGTKN